jgi:cytochrome c-type biogenesis protein CcmH
VTRRRVPWWPALLAALAGALLVGAGVFSSAPPTAAQRAGAIEAGIRCPSCEDLTVRDSDAPTAIAVRAEVAREVAEGRTDDQIRRALVATYGATIVLSPPTTGVVALVWGLPVGGAAVAVVVLAVVLARRRHGGDGGAEPDASADLATLEARRAFLEQSLADAEAEHDAGDLSDEDHRSIRTRDGARLAAVSARIDGPGEPAPAGRASLATAVRPQAPVRSAATPTAGRARSRGAALLMWGAVGAFAAAAVLGVVLLATARQPGQEATGSVPRTRTEQIAADLDQAASDIDQGDDAGATRLYQSVLAEDPTDEVALSRLGFLEYQVGTDGKDEGLVSDGRAMLARAERLAPGDFAVHLYVGTVLLDHDHDAAGAAVEFDRFLAASPPAQVVAEAASTLRAAYAGAGLPVPAGVPPG